jgi:hypothetical protein
MNVGFCTAALAALIAWHGGVDAEPLQQWYLHTGALSYHFEPTRAPGREWNNTHPGLGLERRDALDDDRWQVRWTGGAMRDSRSVWSGYGGSAFMRQWRPVAAMEASAGVGAFLFYRSVDWSGRREWTPALLPTASIGAVDGSMGMNLVYIPRIGKGDGRATPPTVVGQLVFRIR